MVATLSQLRELPFCLSLLPVMNNCYFLNSCNLSLSQVELLIHLTSTEIATKLGIFYKPRLILINCKACACHRRVDGIQNYVILPGSQSLTLFSMFTRLNTSKPRIMEHRIRQVIVYFSKGIGRYLRFDNRFSYTEDQLRYHQGVRVEGPELANLISES